MAQQRLEFWFDFGSTYSYLSAMRIEHEASVRGIAIAWRPFMLGAVFQSLGWQGSPFTAQPAKGRYMWRDMARQCEKFGLTWTQPSNFPRRAVLPHRVALVAEDKPWVGEFCRAVMSRNFADDLELDVDFPQCSRHLRAI
ncbi:2-hydroxychromene-2-carboxylate isomerase [Natronocella acetinitrilica]|uniref:2-hydroxychromene-2-carboxylate isomerase n=1 Tax=Natronocella acetinitrilica TaxID=414046 RepID=A0AAE3G860_9GAMM|nr:DsbA family protein [Natronocella acetinitrilica]MCP1677207.1 2-hydroxychromene-2-carboxylate isomerase [Natronocella acetinitrilica]